MRTALSGRRLKSCAGGSTVAETPQGIPESIVFQKFDGLKNTVDRERLGPRDLAAAINIDLDDDGQPHRRRGRTQVGSGNFHSLYQSEDGTVYGVKNGDLGIVRPDYSFDVLQANVGGNYSTGSLNIAYSQIDDQIFFTSAYCSGIITNSTGAITDWGPSQDFWFSPVVDPTATLPAIKGKLYGGPPRADYLAYYNGRIYLAKGKMLWCTVLYLYSLVDKTRGFIQFENDITMVATVADGLFVGTTEGCWFLQGDNFEALKRIRVMDSPVIPGSAVYIPGELANPPQVGPGVDTPMEVNVAFLTTRGMCVGGDSGKCINLTEGKVFFPVAARAAAYFRRQDGMNQYIVCLDSEGGPVNGARTGDYVDPAIVRGNAAWVDLIENGKAREQYL